jgi:hypothetical protein
MSSIADRSADVNRSIMRPNGIAIRSTSCSAPVAEEPEQEQEQVDEIEIEPQRA